MVLPLPLFRTLATPLLLTLTDFDFLLRRRDGGYQTVRSGRSELRRWTDRVAATRLGVRGQRADDHRTGKRQQRTVPRPGRRRRPRHGAVPHSAVRVRYSFRRQRPGLAHVDGKLRFRIQVRLGLLKYRTLSKSEPNLFGKTAETSFV